MKTIKIEDVKTPVMTSVSLSVREQMEKLARQGNVSLAEIGRRALTQYVEREKVGA